MEQMAIHVLWKSIVIDEAQRVKDGMDQIVRYAEEGDALLTRQTICGLEASLQRIRNAIAED
jgi:hypothetical protein